METTRRIGTTTVSFTTESGLSLTAEAKLTQTGGRLSINENRLELTAVPFCHGAEYWTNSPTAKVISLINGSIVWWLISIEQVFEQIQTRHNTTGGNEK